MSEFEKRGVYYRTRWMLKKDAKVIVRTCCITSLIVVHDGNDCFPVVRVRHGGSGPVLHFTLREFIRNYKPTP